MPDPGTIKESLRKVSLLEPWQRDLLLRVIQSKRFTSKNDKSIDLLLHLVQASHPDDAASRKEAYLVTYLKYGEDARLAMTIGRLQKSLSRYFEDEKCEQWRIGIDQRKRVQSYRRASIELWAAHLPPPVKLKEAHAPEVAIVYDEPKFFRSVSNDYFIRHRDVNDHTPPEEVRLIAETCKLPILEMRESLHYVGVGDAKCMLSVTRWLEKHDVSVLHLGAHSHPTWDLLKGDSLLFIGNTRTHWAVRHVQETMDVKFPILARSIGNPLDKNKPFEDQHSPGPTGCRVAYALLLRRKDSDSGRVITCILANQGPIFDVLGLYLTQEEKVAQLVKDLGLGEYERLPSEFEVVFRANVDSTDHSIHGSVEHVAHRLGRGTPIVADHHYV